MEIILEFILTVIIEVVVWALIALPGAIILKFYRKKNESISTIKNNHFFKSLIIGICFWLVVALVIMFVLQ